MQASIETEHNPLRSGAWQAASPSALLGLSFYQTGQWSSLDRNKNPTPPVEQSVEIAVCAVRAEARLTEEAVW